MKTTNIILVATTGAAVTFALALSACRDQLASQIPGGFGLIPFYLLLPAYVLGEVLASRAAFLITGFLEFFLMYLFGLLGWGRLRGRKQV